MSALFLCTLLFFFFSSRRRHTRCYRDWSSDVCSSDLMSESDEGVSVAATRQKAGKRLNCCTAAGPIPGSVNPPAGTIWAKVIEVFGSTRADKLSHDAAALRACPYIIIVARRTAHDPPVTIFMALSSAVLTRGQRLLTPLAQEFLLSRRLTLHITCD